MTQSTEPVNQHVTLGLGEKPSLLRVVRDQRKIIAVAAGFMVASFWIFGQLGRWPLAGCVAGGVLLALLNHLATELWLLRLITSGQEATRNQMIAATLVRLLVLTVVAVGFAVVFWPDGIGLLLGLAVFRLVALMMTSISLLKELKNQ
ncbi:MAG: hypothetical protein ACR2FG_06970 [Marmoricola sp.]